jgi:hypothetical protein
VAFKNTVGSRRTAHRALLSIKAKEDAKGDKNKVSVLAGYKATIEKELE